MNDTVKFIRGVARILGFRPSVSGREMQYAIRTPSSGR